MCQALGTRCRNNPERGACDRMCTGQDVYRSGCVQVRMCTGQDVYRSGTLADRAAQEVQASQICNLQPAQGVPDSDQQFATSGEFDSCVNSRRQCKTHLDFQLQQSNEIRHQSPAVLGGSRTGVPLPLVQCMQQLFPCGMGCRATAVHSEGAATADLGSKRARGTYRVQSSVIVA
jgi:hypothetical protein